MRLWKAVMILAAAISAGACSTPKMATGDAQLARGEYFDAATTYRKVYNNLKKRSEKQLRGEAAFKMAGCYEKLNMASRAAAAYRSAARYDYPDSSLYLGLGRALQAEGRYKEALEAYAGYLDYRPGDPVAQEGVRGCRKALEGEKTRYVVKPAAELNSHRADFSPMYVPGEYDRLYFTTSTEKAKGDAKSEITGTKRSDIYVAKADGNGRWQRPEPVGGELNSEADEGVVSFSPDGQTMYLTVARRSATSDTSVEIHTSRRSDASWSASQPFDIDADTVSVYGHPAASPDGNWLYFSSDRPGGFGGKDIWRVRLGEHRSEPQNLGNQINTPGDEEFPFIRSDSTIYFASDGHPGYGGLDLFVARKDESGLRWNVENLGQPINSAGDDFGITFGPGEKGYFSSNRGDARGYDNLYSFELPDIEVAISGYVLDKDEEPVPGATVRIIGADGTMKRERAKDDGSFRFRLNRGTKYVMQAGAEGYLNVKQEFESDPAEEDAEYWLDFILVAATKPQTVENVFYDFDRATLRPESKTALDELVALLNEHPNIRIRMTSHTDRVGTEAYNQALSERRAKSVVDYLIAAGIAPARLEYKGMGKTQPKKVTKRISRLYPQFAEGTLLDEATVEAMTDEDREAADQINRRTEFEVTATDYDME